MHQEQHRQLTSMATLSSSSTITFFFLSESLGFADSCLFSAGDSVADTSTTGDAVAGGAGLGSVDGASSTRAKRAVETLLCREELDFLGGMTTERMVLLREGSGLASPQEVKDPLDEASNERLGGNEQSTGNARRSSWILNDR